MFLYAGSPQDWCLHLLPLDSDAVCSVDVADSVSAHSNILGHFIRSSLVLFAPVTLIVFFQGLEHLGLNKTMLSAFY